MANAVYLILILAVAFISIASGFKKGLTGQLASLLGFGFGAVASRIFTPELVEHFQWTARVGQAPEFNTFSSNLVCAVTIYFCVYWIFYLLTPLFSTVYAIIMVGMFNRLLGAAFSLTKNLLWVSILYNLMLCFISDSRLLRYEKADDGNLIAAVISITPAILGCYGGEDFAHFNQLKEAKSISCNFTRVNDVIIKQG